MRSPRHQEPLHLFLMVPALAVVVCWQSAVTAAGPALLTSLTLAPSDSGVRLTAQFESAPPGEPLTYMLLREKGALLVVQFPAARTAGDLSAAVVRPVAHLSLEHDTTGAQAVRAFLLLEEAVPYRQRVAGNAVEVELRWREGEPPAGPPAYLVDITVQGSSDSGAEVVFSLDTLKAPAMSFVAPNRTVIVTRFNGTTCSEGIVPAVLPPLIDSITLSKGTDGRGMPYVKAEVTTRRPVTASAGPEGATHVIRIVPAGHLPAGPDTPVATAHDKHQSKWTYLGVGAGLAAGAAVLGLVLGGNDGPIDRPSTDNTIPPIDVPLPAN